MRLASERTQESKVATILDQNAFQIFPGGASHSPL